MIQLLAPVGITLRLYRFCPRALMPLRRI